MAIKIALKDWQSTYRETDRQTEREGDRQRDRETVRYIERKRERERERKTMANTKPVSLSFASRLNDSKLYLKYEMRGGAIFPSKTKVIKRRHLYNEKCT